MGWKLFKETFNVGHIVQVDQNKLYIGSSYIHNIVQIDMNTGEININNSVFSDFLHEKYPEILECKKCDLIKIFKTKDVFEKSIPVYTFEDGDIIKEYSEELGFPNVTHSGNIIHDNTYFKTEKEAVNAAIEAHKNTLDFFLTELDSLTKERERLESKIEDKLSFLEILYEK